MKRKLFLGAACAAMICGISSVLFLSNKSAIETRAADTYVIASTNPSYSTKRVWVDPKEGFYTASARAGLRVFGGGAADTVYVLSGSSQYTVVDGQTLFYVDIPVNSDCQLVRLHNTDDKIWTYGADFSQVAGYSTSKIVYSWTDSAGYSVSNESKATLEYVKLLIDGYVTCSAGANGYTEIANINAQVAKLSSADQATLRSTAISDYNYDLYEDAGKTYTGTVVKSGSYTYGEKLDEMLSQSAKGASGFMANNALSENNATGWIIASSIVVTSLAAFGIMRIRKSKAESD